MLSEQTTLKEFAKRLAVYAESFGDCEVISVGYSSDHYYLVTVKDANRKDITFHMPMFQDQVEPLLQGDAAITQYMLLSACECGMDLPDVYNTREEAFDSMISGVSDQTEYSFETLKEHFASKTLDEFDDFEDDFGIEDNSAWVTEGNNHENHEWRIVAIKVQANQIIKCE